MRYEVGAYSEACGLIPSGRARASLLRGKTNRSSDASDRLNSGLSGRGME